jgi:hypothetical protein
LLKTHSQQTTTTPPPTPTTTTTKKKKTGLIVTEQLFASRKRQSFLKMGIFFAILSEASKETGNGRKRTRKEGRICSFLMLAGLQPLQWKIP